MQMLSCPVATYCVGEACSGAAVLLVGGSKGKRYCFPNSRVMMHQPMGGVGGQVSDIEIQAAEMFRYRDVLNDIISISNGFRQSRPAQTLSFGPGCWFLCVVFFRHSDFSKNQFFVFF